MPGLEVKGLGPISLPLTPEQAQALKSRCEQAPYGKGEKTIVDTSVRRVWRLKPARFTLRSPDWETFLQQTVRKVQEGLGLEDQKLTSHLYELLLYEPGSFFLSHRDGAKLDRMVATLVFVLPSSFQGGELIVRHEGQEQTISSSGQDSAYRVGFVAFYADCEHEIRPVRAGYRLCLVYNLTLARSSKPLTAPRYGEYVPAISRILHEWGENGKPKKLVVTLEHQYTQKDLTWDGLKGVDRARARILLEAARQAGCQISLALLTLHETGDAECVGGSWGHRGG
jgi:predicted 2-oxoglutarate/Fe(II)-dependent dioxygenase YbiX